MIFGAVIQIIFKKNKTINNILRNENKQKFDYLQKERTIFICKLEQQKTFTKRALCFYNLTIFLYITEVNIKL